MTTEDDVREMLQARAASVRPSADALDRIEAKLDAPAQRSAVRRAPLLAAAALVAIALVGAVLVAQGDDDGTPVTSGETSTSTTSAPTTSTIVPPEQLGVWPAPGDAVDESVLDDPVDTARAYVAARITDVGATTASDFQAGDANSGEVVFNGHVSTTVLVRKTSADRWYVVGSASDLLPVHDAGDGALVMTADADGSVTGMTYDGDVVSNMDRSPIHRGDELWRASSGGAWFALTTDDGSIALAEAAVPQGTTKVIG